MDDFKLSDKAKLFILLAIAIFEIGFIQMKQQPQKAFENKEVQVLESDLPEGQIIANLYNTDLSDEGIPMSVHYLNVGQGDAAYIGYGDFHMLIDGGEKEDGTYVVDYLQAQGVSAIDILVASHIEDDHIGGLEAVLRAFPVDTIIDSGESGSTVAYKKYKKAAEKNGAPFLMDTDKTYEIDDSVSVEIIEAVDDHTLSNNNSVIVKVTYNEVSFLFTGDLEKEVEEQILTKNIHSTVFKAGHHGSSTANSDMFLRRVQPEVIIISAGLDNEYGYPHREALARMKKQTDQIFGTWMNGTIVIHTNGVELQVGAEKVVTMADAHASKGIEEQEVIKPVEGTSKEVLEHGPIIIDTAL